MLMPNREQCLRRMAVRSCRGDRTEVSSKHKGHLLCRCPLHGTPDQTLTGGLPLRSLAFLLVRYTHHNFPLFLIRYDTVWLLVNLHKNPSNAASLWTVQNVKLANS